MCRRRPLVSASTATRIQLNFHSNLLCTYTSRLKQISSWHQHRCTKRNIYWNDSTQLPVHQLH